MLRPRNFVARSALLRKGGIHIESKSNLRNNAKHAIEDELLDWQEEHEQTVSALKADDTDA